MNIHSAIVKGPEKEILQDAIGVVNHKDYILLIVTDGLGSAKHSDYGAKTAVRAVEKAIIQWRNLEKKNVRVLIQLIHFFWNLIIGDSDYNKNSCLTTCLFAYIDKKSNEVILAQLGDGVLFFDSKKESTIIKSSEDYNYTKSLGSSKSFDDWNIKKTYCEDKSFSLMMTTDGISEDIVEGKEKDFTESLILEMSKIKKNCRNNYLRRLLKNWPTKYHTDDKTICIAWEKTR